MHVREFTKPANIKVRVKQPRIVDGKQDIVEVEHTYSFDDYVAEFVWAYSKWNTDDGWDEAQIRLGEALDAAAPGEVVKIASLDDWERLREANKAASITGPNAPRVRALQRAIKSAEAPKPVMATPNGVERSAACPS